MRQFFALTGSLIWGTRDGWASVRQRGVRRFMLRGALGFACWLALFVGLINAVRGVEPFTSPIRVGAIVAYFAVHVAVMFCLGLGVARLMWHQREGEWVHEEIRRSMAQRAATEP